MQQINNSFGSGGMSLALNEMQFASFFQHLKNNNLHGTLPIKKAASIIGLQVDSNEPVWVLNKDLQLSLDGEIIPECERKFIWIEQMITGNLLSLNLQELLPIIKTPLCTSVLNRLVKNMQQVMKHNFVPAVLAASSIISALQYSNLSDASPIVVCEGPSQTGKSTTLRIALALLGVEKESIYEKSTNTFILERASSSTLPFGIDDPEGKPSRGSDLNDVIVELYNRGRSATFRKGAKTPRSLPIISTNYKLRQEERVLSRVCILPFKKPTIAPSTDEEQDAFDYLEELIESQAISSSIGWIIRQGNILKDKEEMKSMKSHLRRYYKGRSITNWSLLALCAKQVNNFIFITLVFRLS
jgi:hypothetical protein